MIIKIKNIYILNTKYKNTTMIFLYLNIKYYMSKDYDTFEVAGLLFLFLNAL